MASKLAPRKVKESGRITKRTWLLIGVAAFLVFDAVLIAFALMSTKTPEAVGERPGSTPSISTPERTAEPEPAETAIPEPIALVSAPDRVISALNEMVAYRAVTGRCADTPAVIEVTTDGGQSWGSTDASNDGELRSVQSVTVINEDEAAAIVLAGSDCSPRLTATFVAGDAWSESVDRLAGNVYLGSPERATVHFPTASMPAPCAIAALATRGEARAAVLCSDSSIMTTTDAGASWTGPLAVAGATNIDANGDGYVVAFSGQNGCDVAVAQLSRDLELGGFSSCVPSSAPPGTAGLSGTEDGIIWIWIGDATVKSSDGGASWW